MPSKKRASTFGPDLAGPADPGPVQDAPALSTLTLIASDASPDSYSYTESSLLSGRQLSGNVVTLNVLANDSAGSQLYGVDNGNAGDGSTALDGDPLATTGGKGKTGTSTTSAWELTASGNLVRIYNGQVQLDLTNSLTALGAYTVKGLGDGQAIVDSFTYAIKLTDGSTSMATVSFSVTGEGAAFVNRPAAITGASTATVVEDSGSYVAKGKLTVSDPDTGQASFRPLANQTGQYGSFTLDAGTGAWTYTLDNAAWAVQKLGAGQSATDTAQVYSFDATAMVTLTATVQGRDNVFIGGRDLAWLTNADKVTIDGVDRLRTSGQLVAQELDLGVARQFVLGTGTTALGGSYKVDADGHWNYLGNYATLAAPAGVVTDSFTVHTVDGTARTVTIRFDQDLATVRPVASARADVVITSSDTLSAGKGDDYVDDRSAFPASLQGDAGNDYLQVGNVNGSDLGATPGNGSLSGGDGNDTLLGGELGDTLLGGSNDDRLHGGGGDDALDGGAGNDTLFGGDGNDALQGGLGDDLLVGGPGLDMLQGGDGNDTLMAGPGGASLDGGVGADRLFTTDGASGVQYLLRGGDGADQLMLGAGDDLITLEASLPADTIYDFGIGHDQLGLLGLPGLGVNILDGRTLAPHLLLTFASQAALLAAPTAAYARVAWVPATPAPSPQPGKLYFLPAGQGGAGAVALATLADLHGPLGPQQILLGEVPPEVALASGQTRIVLNGLEDNGANQFIAHGRLEAVDGSDGSEAAFVARTLTTALGATFTVGADGAWTYALPLSAGASGDIRELVPVALADGNGLGLQVEFDASGTSVITGGASGTSGDDTLLGTAPLYGAGGTDSINGGEGNDYIEGRGGAADVLVGNGGDDTLVAGGDGAILWGMDGNDRLDGGAGDDYLDGGADEDRLFGFAGNDSLYGQDGNDLLVGGAGDDYLDGGAGDDTLVAGTGSHTLVGGEGHDRLHATASAASDSNRLEGGAGDDALFLGAGHDRIVLGGGLGVDTIDGFDALNDTLELSVGNGLPGLLLAPGETTISPNHWVTFASEALFLASTPLAVARLAWVATGPGQADLYYLPAGAGAASGTPLAHFEAASNAPAPNHVVLTDLPPTAIGGDAMGQASEDGARSDSGQLTLSGGYDLPADFTRFQVTSPLSGTYGHFEFDTDTGQWAYFLHNASEAVQALAGTDTVQDTLEVYSWDGATSTLLTVDIQGSADARAIAGNTLGLATARGGWQVLHGTAAVSGDGGAGGGGFLPVAPGDLAGDYGSFTFDAATGHWTYAPDPGNLLVQELAPGAQLEDTLAITSADGQVTGQLVARILGQDPGHLVDGSDALYLTGGDTVAGAAVPTLGGSGRLVAFDLATGQDIGFVAASGWGSGGLGQFTIDAQGHWSYRAVAGNLDAAHVAMDQFQVATAAGETRVITVTLDPSALGVNAGASEVGNNLLGTDGGDVLFARGLAGTLTQIQGDGGGAGDDYIDGRGNSLVTAVVGMGGNDLLVAPDGPSNAPMQAVGGDGDDRLFASACFNAVLFGGNGNDSLFGGDGIPGDPSLSVNALVGGAGDDLLVAGATTSFLDGGGGNNLLKLGTGSDTVQFTTAGGTDRVFGFDASQDMFEFVAGNFAGEIDPDQFFMAVATPDDLASLAAEGNLLVLVTAGPDAVPQLLYYDPTAHLALETLAEFDQVQGTLTAANFQIPGSP